MGAILPVGKVFGRDAGPKKQAGGGVIRRPPAFHSSKTSFRAV